MFRRGNTKPGPRMAAKIAAQKAAIRKIGYQFDKEDAHQRLMFDIVSQAIRDLNISMERNTALLYLNGDMPHAQACGVDPDWIRDVLKKCGINIDMPTVSEKKLFRV